MGTRGAYGFRIDGKDKVQYNHFDSYPSELGKNVVEAIRKIRPKADVIRGIRMVKEDAAPTKQDIKQLGHLANTNVSSQSVTEWYVLLREAQGDISKLLSGELPVMIDNANFLADSLFCEWAYIINMDSGTLEVYQGFNKDPNAAGRYASLRDEDGYCGVKLIDEVALGSIPDLSDAAVEEMVARWEGQEE